MELGKSTTIKMLTGLLTPTSGKVIVNGIVPNEKRILSVDVALLASKKHNNDAAALIINSAIPTEKNDYIIPISFILMVIATSIVVYDKIKNKKNR